MLNKAIKKAKSAYDLIRAASNFIENLFFSAFSLLRTGMLMGIEVLFMPAIFYYSAKSLVGMAGTNHWLGSWMIATSKKAVIGLLTRAEQLPVIGVMFTPAVLPWVIYLAIGKLIYAHFKQMWREQNKMILQENKQLKPDEQKSYLKNFMIYIHIFSSPAQKEKASAMRLLLSVFLPTFLFLFRSFCGVNPATALLHSGLLSMATNLLPYGLIGVVGEGTNFVRGLINRWQPLPPVLEPELNARPILNNAQHRQQPAAALAPPAPEPVLFSNNNRLRPETSKQKEQREKRFNAAEKRLNLKNSHKQARK